jgi:DNA-directed RNA polymerase subunit RPC12/RpoP
MAKRPQLPITEQMFAVLPDGTQEKLDAISDEIRELFLLLEDDDINAARKIWRDLNAQLLKAFTMGVYEISCQDCGEKWSMARRQALNEIEQYRDRKKECPHCKSKRLKVDFELSMAVKDGVDAARKYRQTMLLLAEEAEAKATAEAAEAAAVTAETIIAPSVEAVQAETADS